MCNEQSDHFIGMDLNEEQEFNNSFTFFTENGWDKKEKGFAWSDFFTDNNWTTNKEKDQSYSSPGFLSENWK